MPTTDSRNLLAAVRDAKPRHEQLGPLVAGRAAAHPGLHRRIAAASGRQDLPGAPPGRFSPSRRRQHLRLRRRARRRRFAGLPAGGRDSSPTSPMTRSQVALFDRLIVDDGIAKVVDLGSAAYRALLHRSSRRSTLSPRPAAARSSRSILFAADPHPASAEAYADLRAAAARHRGGAGVQRGDHAGTPAARASSRSQRAAAVPLQIPVLAPTLKAQADRLPYAFAYFHDRLPPQVPVELAFELRSWTRRTFLEFRELQLRLLLEEAARLAGAACSPGSARPSDDDPINAPRR